MPIYEPNKLRTLEVSAKRKPIVVNNANDPRLKAYKDSLDIYNDYKVDYKNEIYKPNIGYKLNNNKSTKIPISNNYWYEQGIRTNKKMLPIGWAQSKGFSEGTGHPVFKKPVQPIVYQKPVQQTVQPVTQPTQTTNEVKENWIPTQNTIMYNMNGKTMYSTSDKINELFKIDIEEMTAAGASPETINTLLKRKYGIKERGTTYTPDDATQKAINVRATNLYKK